LLPPPSTLPRSGQAQEAPHCQLGDRVQLSARPSPRTVHRPSANTARSKKSSSAKLNAFLFLDNPAIFYSSKCYAPPLLASTILYPLVAYDPTVEQQAIIAHDIRKHARILAGPGTGKSVTTVALVDRVLAGNPAPRVKLLTFTRAATAELANTVSAHPAAAAGRPSTIHSFSISILRRNPGSGDFPQPLRIADGWEENNIVHRTLARQIRVRVDHLEKLIREMAANWELLGECVRPRVDPAERARFVGAWNEHRQIYGYTLLAEIPFALRQALSDHPDLQGVEYDLLIVDEYQDLNSCDLDVLHRIAERGCSIIAAGDDDQSIYSFRYADPAGIRRFPDDYPGCSRYPLTITQRCGRRIVEWASYVIVGDPDRPRDRPVLECAHGSVDGEVALLHFRSEVAEAQGIAALVRQLIEHDCLAPEAILVLLRGDYRGTFSSPIKRALDHGGIKYSDPDAVERMLAEPENRRTLATLHLLVNDRDSLAWASLLLLAPGIGRDFCDYVYERARLAHVQFGEALFIAYERDFPDAPRSPRRSGR
jgi:DNA helicase II / ATP-dependent DNA helicase PcrA